MNKQAKDNAMPIAHAHDKYPCKWQTFYFTVSLTFSVRECYRIESAHTVLSSAKHESIFLNVNGSIGMLKFKHVLNCFDVSGPKKVKIHSM